MKKHFQRSLFCYLFKILLIYSSKIKNILPYSDFQLKEHDIIYKWLWYLKHGPASGPDMAIIRPRTGNSHQFNKNRYQNSIKHKIVKMKKIAERNL